MLDLITGHQARVAANRGLRGPTPRQVFRMLTTRQETILKLMVDEYVTTATPVASESVARSPELAVSPATVRKEMVELEEAGYIARPHTSAGTVPLDSAYRL